MDEPLKIHPDGKVPSPERLADIAAIQDLVVAYGFAVDDRDWPRWTALFTDDAHLDYTHSGGIAATITEVAAWMPQAMSVFTWSLHSVLTHEIRFTSATTATGRVHLFNRNGVEWNGTLEICDVGGRYLDDYCREGDVWRFSRRVEESLYITGGEFAALVRDLAATTAPDRTPPQAGGKGPRNGPVRPRRGRFSRLGGVLRFGGGRRRRIGGSRGPRAGRCRRRSRW